MTNDAAALVAAIVEDPSDTARWQVYADWLLDRGDARGELINLELAAETAGILDAHQQVVVDGVHGPAWRFPNQTFGPDVELARKIDRMRHDEDRWLSPRLAAQAFAWHFTFRRSFIYGVEMTGGIEPSDGGEPIAALFADPHAGLLERFEGGLDGDLRDAMFAEPRRRLRYLGVRGIGPWGSKLGELLPDLDELDLHGDGADMPVLRHESLRTLAANAGSCPAVVEGRFVLPALRVLAWRFSEDDPLLANTRSILFAPPPQLRSLRISAYEDDLGQRFLDIAVAGLVATPLAATLEALAIEGCTTAVIDEVCRANAQLTALREVSLAMTYGGEFGDARAELARVFPQIVIREDPIR